MYHNYFVITTTTKTTTTHTVVNNKRHNRHHKTQWWATLLFFFPFIHLIRLLASYSQDITKVKSHRISISWFLDFYPPYPLLAAGKITKVSNHKTTFQIWNPSKLVPEEDIRPCKSGQRGPVLFVSLPQRPLHNKSWAGVRVVVWIRLAQRRRLGEREVYNMIDGLVWSTIFGSRTELRSGRKLRLAHKHWAVDTLVSLVSLFGVPSLRSEFSSTFTRLDKPLVVVLVVVVVLPLTLAQLWSDNHTQVAFYDWTRAVWQSIQYAVGIGLTRLVNYSPIVRIQMTTISLYNGQQGQPLKRLSLRFLCPSK